MPQHPRGRVDDDHGDERRQLKLLRQQGRPGHRNDWENSHGRNHLQLVTFFLLSTTSIPTEPVTIIGSGQPFFQK